MLTFGAATYGVWLGPRSSSATLSSILWDRDQRQISVWSNVPQPLPIRRERHRSPVADRVSAFPYLSADSLILIQPVLTARFRDGGGWLLWRLQRAAELNDAAWAAMSGLVFQTWHFSSTISAMGCNRTTLLWIVGIGVLFLASRSSGDPATPPPAKSPAHPDKEAKQEITNSIGIKLVLIRAGNFRMGSPESDKDARDGESPQHRVRITKPFYLGKFEVTRGDFRKFGTATKYKTDAGRGGTGGWGYTGNPLKPFNLEQGFTWRNSGFEQTDDYPVINVSWNDADAFCRWLTKNEMQKYRLPTELSCNFTKFGKTPTEIALPLHQFGEYGAHLTCRDEQFCRNPFSLDTLRHSVAFAIAASVRSLKSIKVRQSRNAVFQVAGSRQR